MYGMMAGNVGFLRNLGRLGEVGYSGVARVTMEGLYCRKGWVCYKGYGGNCAKVCLSASLSIAR
jgi:hypothetical protein